MITAIPITQETTPAVYWATCATEWHHVAEGAHEGGNLPVELYFNDLAESAVYAAYILTDDEII
jgi:hypothetical protein